MAVARTEYLNTTAPETSEDRQRAGMRKALAERVGNEPTRQSALDTMSEGQRAALQAFMRGDQQDASSRKVGMHMFNKLTPEDKRTLADATVSGPATPAATLQPSSNAGARIVANKLAAGPSAAPAATAANVDPTTAAGARVNNAVQSTQTAAPKTDDWHARVDAAAKYSGNTFDFSNPDHVANLARNLVGGDQQQRRGFDLVVDNQRYHFSGPVSDVDVMQAAQRGGGAAGNFGRDVFIARMAYNHPENQRMLAEGQAYMQRENARRQTEQEQTLKRGQDMGLIWNGAEGWKTKEQSAQDVAKAQAKDSARGYYGFVSPNGGYIGGFASQELADRAAQRAVDRTRPLENGASYAPPAQVAAARAETAERTELFNRGATGNTIGAAPTIAEMRASLQGANQQQKNVANEEAKRQTNPSFGY